MNNFIGKHTFQQKKWRKDGWTRAYTNLVVWPSPYACLFHQSFFVKRDQRVAPDLHISSAKSSQRSCQPSTVLYFQLRPLKKTLHKPYVHTIFIDQNKNSSKLSRTANKCHEGNQSDVSYFHQKFPTRQRGQAPVSSRLHCKLPSVPKLSFQLTHVANFRKWISKVQSEQRGLYQLLVITDS